LAVVVVGGQSRKVGKTSVVAGLIARLPEMRWTAVKISQYSYDFCAANGAPCACLTADHSIAVSEERSVSSGTDTARFLAAGAARSIWVRTRQGRLAEAMPRIQKELAAAENAILESNSVMEFLQPDVYLTVLDAGTTDWKASVRLYLDRADAVLLQTKNAEPQWPGISAELLRGKPQLLIEPPEYLTNAVVAFVRERIGRGIAAVTAPSVPPSRAAHKDWAEA
jgi:hypothetical protein